MAKQSLTDSKVLHREIAIVFHSISVEDKKAMGNSSFTPCPQPNVNVFELTEELEWKLVHDSAAMTVKSYNPRQNNNNNPFVIFTMSLEDGQNCNQVFVCSSDKKIVRILGTSTLMSMPRYSPGMAETLLKKIITASKKPAIKYSSVYNKSSSSKRSTSAGSNTSSTTGRIRPPCGFLVNPLFKGKDVDLQPEWCMKRKIDGTVTYRTDSCLERLYKNVLGDHYSKDKNVKFTLPLLISIPSTSNPRLSSTCLVVKKYETIINEQEVVLWLFLLKITDNEIQPQVIATSRKPIEISDLNQLKNNYRKQIIKDLEDTRTKNPFRTEKMGSLNMMNQRKFLYNNSSHSVSNLNTLKILDLPNE